MDVTPELLGAFPLLKTLPPETLSWLAAKSSLQKVARRAVLLNAGKIEEHVCFLFEGRLQGVDFTVDGREVGLYFVEPGEICGEISLFDHGPQPEYVIGLTASVVIFVPMDCLREIMLTNSAVVKVLGEKMAARVRKMTYQRALLGLPNIVQRICCQLWLLVSEAEKKQNSQAIIKNPPTHMEIAIMLNLSRETVTRTFQALQSRNIVKRDGNSRLIVTSALSLRELAEGKAEL